MSLDLSRLDGTVRTKLDDPIAAQKQDPADYIPSPELLAAAETAIILGQPLLLTGESGSGKSSFAEHLAWLLGHHVGRDEPRNLRVHGRSGMEVWDLFYRYDEIGRYQEGTTQPREAFLTLQGLGEALLRASDPKETAALRTAFLRDAPQEQTREVVLIDEIDKAPRDVPNDLLALMSSDTFRVPIPELSRGAAPVQLEVPLAKMPIMIVTSNSEKSLPEPFLRRCVYYHIPFPEDDLGKIVDKRVYGAPADSPLTQEAVALVLAVRNRAPLKKPGLAELIGFVQARRERLGTADAGLGEGWRNDAAATLLKLKDDRDRARDLLGRD